MRWLYIPIYAGAIVVGGGIGAFKWFKKEIFGEKVVQPAFIQLKWWQVPFKEDVCLPTKKATEEDFPQLLPVKSKDWKVI